MSRPAAVGLLVAFFLLLLLVLARFTHASYAGSTATRTNPHDLVRGFMCIHRYEASWTADTGNGYHGGLQMDLTFQRAYGREFLNAFGTANNWPPAVQITVAIRAYLSGRGWGPWPNTARRCGLL